MGVYKPWKDVMVKFGFQGFDTGYSPGLEFNLGGVDVSGEDI